jgi:Nucleotidyltransferase domain
LSGGGVDVLKSRQAYAARRIAALKRAVSSSSDIARHKDLCVYVTGSYGRLEASRYSDLDLFFVHNGTAREDKLSNIDKALFDAELIKICRRLRFPEFTKGGVYLQVHYIGDILEKLGGPEDDYLNYFTARMLLLSESLPIANEQLYLRSIGRIVQSYFRDFHDHDKDFRPIFLVNDIARYWKTMCLNYENIRNRQTLTPYEKNKVHIKNFKLKYSRLLTCFSLMAAILAPTRPMSSQYILRTIMKTPTERLRAVSEGRRELAVLVDSLLADYSWFLTMTGKPEAAVVRWIADRERRDVAFTRARRFGGMMFDLLGALTKNSDTMRYLIL